MRPLKQFRHREEYDRQRMNAIVRQTNALARPGIVNGEYSEGPAGVQSQVPQPPQGFWAKITAAGQNTNDESTPEERRQLPDNRMHYEWEEVTLSEWNDTTGAYELAWKTLEGGRTSTLLDNCVIVHPAIATNLSTSIPAGTVVWLYPSFYTETCDENGEWGFGTKEHLPSIEYGFEPPAEAVRKVMELVLETLVQDAAVPGWVGAYEFGWGIDVTQGEWKWKNGATAAELDLTLGSAIAFGDPAITFNQPGRYLIGWHWRVYHAGHYNGSGTQTATPSIATYNPMYAQNGAYADLYINAGKIDRLRLASIIWNPGIESGDDPFRGFSDYRQAILDIAEGDTLKTVFNVVDIANAMGYVWANSGAGTSECTMFIERLGDVPAEPEA